MDQVPVDAIGVLRVSRLVDPGSTTRPATGPAVVRDPVDVIEAAMGVRPVGLDAARDVAIYVPSGVTERNPSPVVLLLPVGDYAAFLAAQPAGTTKLGVTAIRPATDGADTFISPRGTYVAVSRAKASLAGGHGGMRVSPEERARWESAEVGVYVNGPEVTGVLVTGARHGWPLPTGPAASPSHAMNRLLPSDLDPEINVANQLQDAIGWPHDAAAMRYAFGKLCFSKSDLGGAMEQLQLAVAMRPDQADYHVAMANVLVETGRIQAATDQFREAVRLDPRNFDAFHNAGLVLYRYGKYGAAAKLLSRAVELRPKSAPAHSDYGAALVRLHRYSEATLELRAALVIDPKCDAARMNLKVVRHLATTGAATSRPAN
jgi:hypothetical protein